MHKDTGHKIYTGSGRQGGEPYILFGGSSMAPFVGVLDRQPTKGSTRSR
jgi:hypothetical protein